MSDKLHLRDILRFAAVWLGAALILIFAVFPKMSLPLHWDEVDYVVAARQGILANATDSTALSAGEFVELLRAKDQGRVPRVSSGYDESTDVFILRHFHPPLLQYALALLGTSRLAPGHEFWQRLVQLVAGVLLIGTMLWGYAVISPQRTVPGTILVTVSGLLCALLLSRDLTNHLWIAITLVPVSLAVGRLMRQTTPQAALVAGGSLAISFLGIEMGLFVAFCAVVALGISVLSQPLGPGEAGSTNLRRKLRLFFEYTAWMVAGFFGVLLVTYPGAIFRISLVRILLIYGFRIQQGSEYAPVSDMYFKILPQVLPLLVLSVIGGTCLILRRDLRRNHFLLATTVIGLGYGMIMSQFVLNVTYIVPPLVLLSLLSAATISSIGSKHVQWIAAGFIASYIFAVSANLLINHAQYVVQPTVARIKSLADVVGNRKAWIEGGHILRYYRPDIAGQIGSIIIAENGGEPTTRNFETLRYEPITDEQLAGSVVMLGIFNGKPLHEWEKRLPEGTRTLDSPVGSGRIYVFPDKIATRSDSSSPPADPGKEDGSCCTNMP